MADDPIREQLLEHLVVMHECKTPLLEYVNYNQLVAATRDFWSTRFKTVKDVVTAPPEIVVLKTGDTFLSFNCRSRPPTGSGRPHDGNITFYPDQAAKKRTADRLKDWWQSLKSRLSQFVGKKVPPKILKASELRQMKCKVTCDCEDFKYRLEVANHSKDGADIKHSNGARPNITNPDMRPGLCKHLLGMLRYLTDDASIQANPEGDQGKTKDSGEDSRARHQSPEQAPEHQELPKLDFGKDKKPQRDTTPHQRPSAGDTSREGSRNTGRQGPTQDRDFKG